MLTLTMLQLCHAWDIFKFTCAATERSKIELMIH